ncbi:hypothetical protein TFLX_04128 [Thermoflexales bacterium]|nr:hypothetical protein TFLX_04128 [Thermoflexales bacterium]
MQAARRANPRCISRPAPRRPSTSPLRPSPQSPQSRADRRTTDNRRSLSSAETRARQFHAPRPGSSHCAIAPSSRIGPAAHRYFGGPVVRVWAYAGKVCLAGTRSTLTRLYCAQYSIFRMRGKRKRPCPFDPSSSEVTKPPEDFFVYFVHCRSAMLVLQYASLPRPQPARCGSHLPRSRYVQGFSLSWRSPRD